MPTPNSCPWCLNSSETKTSPTWKTTASNINRGILESLHSKIEANRQNNKNIIKLFPDIELAIQILISYILSPKKMTDTQLNYKFKKTLKPRLLSQRLCWSASVLR